MKQDKRKKSALIAAAVVIGFWLTVGAGFVGYNLATNSPNNQAGIDSGADGNQTITVEEADLEKMDAEGTLTEEIDQQRKRDSIQSALNMLYTLEWVLYYRSARHQ